MKIILDISRACPHKCIYCYFHKFGLSDNRMMDMDVFTRLMPILRREVSFVYLYMSGEPFLNNSVYFYIKKLLSANIDVEVATKLGVKIDFTMLKGAISGKGKIKFLVGLDGYSQDTVNNICTVNMKLKGENQQQLMALARKKPNVTVQYSTIHNEYNKDEPIKKKKPMGLFRHDLYKKAGINISTIIPDHNCRLTKNGVIKDNRCKFINVPAISVDGDMLLCCHDFTYDTKCGNVIEAGSIKKAMESAEYKENRKKGLNKEFNVCKDCC